MTEQADRRSDATRLQILRAASRQFARRPYALVSLDDILGDAEVTKGAMYFHFRSKHALASEIVEYQADAGRISFDQMLARGLSAFESLVDIALYIATQDITEDMARAGLNLMESVGRADGLQQRILDSWIAGFSRVCRRAVDEGDIVDGRDPDSVARLLVSIYLGLRQASSLDEPKRFLHDHEQAWRLILPGFVNPDRIGYLTEFIARRTALAIRKVSSRQTDVL